MKKELTMLLTLVILILICQSLLAQSWTTPQNVTNNSVFDQRPSLDIGPAPYLVGEAAHIAYNRFDIKEIYYALKEFAGQPPTWNFFQVTDRTATNAPNSENWEVSLKVLPTGRVYVAYRGDVINSDKEIFITNNVNGSFNFLPSFVTMNSTDDEEPSLFIQVSSPHVAYVGEGGTGSATDDEVWYDDFQTKSQVTTNGSPEVAPSLTVDGNGKAHTAFAGIGGPAPAGDKEIWYAENTTGTWVITQVSVNSFEDTNPSIWLEASGAIHIAWQGLTDDWDIYYTNNVTNPFPNANVLVAAETGDEQEPSLVIDPFGNAHIAYQWTVGAQPDEQIYWTDNMSGTFTSQMGAQTLVSTSGSTDNIFPSMDIDSNNFLHLAYQGFDGADTEIYYTVTNGVVPVELVSFEAVYHDREVILRWATATESNNYGFEIERSREGIEFNKIGFVAGHGTTVVPRTYSFVDSNIKIGIYYYRLKQIDFDGSYNYSQILEVVVEPPSTFRLEQNFPNPFNPSTAISYSIPSQERVKLDIYNLRGEHVINLVTKVQEAGNYFANWNGRNKYGDEVASGVYVTRLKTERFSKGIKMLKLQ